MVDFTTPNLCGASEEFNKLASQFSSIKDSLQASLEGEIDALKSELTASLAVLEADIKGLIPELPEIPDISLISEIQNLISLPAGSLASLSALANLKLQFGDALAEAGFALDSLVSDATAAFSGGIDLCGGGLPNFVIGPNGIPTLKPEDSGMPNTDPKRLGEDDDILGEAASTLLTPAAEILKSNASLISSLTVASEKIKERAKEITIDISAERGNISKAVRIVFDRGDVLAQVDAAEAGIPTTPQIAKITVAVASTSNLPLAPAAPVAPAAAPVVEKTSNTAGVSPLTVGEVQAKLKVIQDSITSAKNEVNRLSDKLIQPGLFSKAAQDHPHNLISADRKIVNDKSKTITWNTNVLNNHEVGGSRTGNMGQIYGFYLKRFQHLSKRRKEIESLISGLLASKADPSQPIPEEGVTGDKIKEAADELIEDYVKTGEELEDVYIKAKKAFSVPVPPPPTPPPPKVIPKITPKPAPPAPTQEAPKGLHIVKQRNLGFVKQYELSDGRVVRERDLAGLGLTAP
jgi:hypothetical protein